MPSVTLTSTHELAFPFFFFFKLPLALQKLCCTERGKLQVAYMPDLLNSAGDEEIFEYIDYL